MQAVFRSLFQCSVFSPRIWAFCTKLLDYLKVPLWVLNYIMIYLTYSRTNIWNRKTVTAKTIYSITEPNFKYFKRKNIWFLIHPKRGFNEYKHWFEIIIIDASIFLILLTTPTWSKIFVFFYILQDKIRELFKKQTERKCQRGRQVKQKPVFPIDDISIL